MAEKTAAPTKPAGNSTTAPPAPRQRAAISNERRLALLLAALVAFCDVSKLKGDAIENARAAAKDMTDKVIKPITDRLKVLRAELGGFNMATVDVAKLKEVSGEIAKLEGRLKTINEQAEKK